MPRFIRALAIIALVLMAGPVAAGTIAQDKIAEVNSAAEAFAKLGEPSRQSGKPPRATDPAAKTLIDTVFDLRVLSAAEPLPFSEIGKVNAWNKAILTVGTVYILSGTGVADISQAGSDPNLAPKVEKNTVEFAPEMGRYFDAQLGIAAAMLATVNSHLAANPADREKPNFKAGLPDIFAGTAQTLYSAITTLPTEGLSDDWRLERLPAIERLSPHVAAVVDAADLKTIHDTTSQIAESTSNPRLKEGLRKIAAIFKR
jgi:hypothetical protein